MNRTMKELEYIATSDIEELKKEIRRQEEEINHNERNPATIKEHLRQAKELDRLYRKRGELRAFLEVLKKYRRKKE